MHALSLSFGGDRYCRLATECSHKVHRSVTAMTVNSKTEKTVGPGRKRVLVHLELERTHLMATNLIFLKCLRHKFGIVVVMAQQLISCRQLSRLRKSATAARLSHRSCTVSCVRWL